MAADKPIGKSLISTILEILEFLPIIVFGYMGTKPDADLGERFFTAGGLAAVIMIASVILRRPMNPLALAANLFLFVCAAAFPLELAFLVQVISILREVALFMVILAVGLVATLRWQRGFIWSEADDKEFVTKASYIMLAGAGVAAIIAFDYRGDEAIAGAVPYIGLVVLQKVLSAYAIARESEEL